MLYICFFTKHDNVYGGAYMPRINLSKQFITHHSFLAATILILGVIVWGCASTGNIYSLCEKDRQGNYIVKWEVSPGVGSEEMKIYSAPTDLHINEHATLQQIVKTDDRVAVFHPSHNSVREFFLMSSRNLSSGIITNRYIPLHLIQNFRDLGGYFTENNQQVRWGKLFRSGAPYAFIPQDEEILKQLGIRTFVDLRPASEHFSFLEYPAHINVETIGIDTLGIREIESKITIEFYQQKNVSQHIKQGYWGILKHYTKQLQEIFNLLLEEQNYPILLFDNLGKDRIGVVSFLILKALDVNNEDIFNDYLLSNQYINLQDYALIMYGMPETMQEAMTTALRADRDFLEYALENINKEYGSVENYLEKELNLTASKRKELQKLLLY